MKLLQRTRLQQLLVLVLSFILIMPGIPVEAASKKNSDKAPITRGEVLQSVNKLLGATQVYGDMKTVSNMKLGDKYYSTVSIALNAGYISKSKNNTVSNPAQKATTQYIANVLAKALGVSKKDVIGKKSAKANMTKAEFTAVLDEKVPNIISKSASMVKKGNVVVNKPGVVLSDMTIEGNLIVADGVGTGEIELNNVTVKGKCIVRGGGENSVKIYGNSSVSKMIVRQANNKVSIKVTGDASVKLIYVNDGCNDVVIVGNVGELNVAGNNLNVETKEGTIGNVVVTGANSSLAVDESSAVEAIKVNDTAKACKLNVSGKVKQIETNAPSVAVQVNKTAEVETLVSNGENTAVAGTGKLVKAEVNGNDSKINTENTKVQVSDKVTGTVINDKTTDGTATPTTTPTAPSGPSGSSGTSSPSGPSEPSGPSNPSGPSSPSGPSEPSGPSNPSDPQNPAVGSDDRFENGYPKVELVKEDYSTSAKITLKLKDGVASEENPVTAYISSAYYCVDLETDTEAVIHGHIGSHEEKQHGDSRYSQISTCDSKALKLTDSVEHELSFPVYSQDEGYVCYFVLQSKEKTTENPVMMKLDSDTGKSFLDTQAPYVTGAYISDPVEQDGNMTRAIRVYFNEELSAADSVLTSAFTVTGSAMNVTISEPVVHTDNGNYKSYNNYLDLKVCYPSSETVDDLSIFYTKPEAGGICDTANVPNCADSFVLKMNGVDDNRYEELETLDLNNNIIRKYYSKKFLQNSSCEIKDHAIKVSQDGKHIGLCIKPMIKNFTESDYTLIQHLKCKINGEEWKLNGYYYSSNNMEVRFVNESATLKDNYDIEISMDNMDAYNTVTGEAKEFPIIDHSVSFEIVDNTYSNAVYHKASKTLTVTRAKNAILFGSGCDFVLVIDGKEYRLRAMIKNWAGTLDSTFDDQCLFNVTDVLDNATTIQLKLDPLSSHYSDETGAPVNDLSVEVTKADD